ncbi:acyl carrier protein, partial [Streptomyces sp. NPDC127033]|uniref:acyl carrier protein n=1 Tax=Streptomyces sp. NPDC127033 TaxID=3347110 RepID=UPI003653611D
TIETLLNRIEELLDHTLHGQPPHIHTTQTPRTPATLIGPLATSSGDTGASPASPATVDTVRRLFEEVLHQSDIGESDDFFELGGHSLTATRLVKKIRDRLEVRIPIRVLMTTPTVGALAAEIDVRRMTAGS